MDRHRPFSADVFYDQAHQFKQGMTGVKSTFRFGDFTQLPMNSFNGIGGVNDFPNSGIVRIESRQVKPIIYPRFTAQRIFLPPLLFELQKPLLWLR
ncbi:MAG: hypothetical protein JWQ63_4307 [Mucilaginibacter sp.]|nr:hypothetical protein [Mucilaginibacter sp.]